MYKVPSIKFYENRNKFLAFSTFLILLGFFASFFFGIRLDIQFKGGSIITYRYEGQVSLDAVRDEVAQALDNPVTVQSTEGLNANENNEKITSLVISVAGNQALTNDESIRLTQVLEEKFPENKMELTNAQLVNPFIGKRTLYNGLLAVALASVLIVLYVWVRFRSISGASAGVFSLIALFHDVAIVFFTFVLMRIALNETLIAVMLSILGWSVNDTIVIFDRIRENERLHRNKLSLPELVNLSINQSLTRSINTSLCSFISVSMAYLFAHLYGLESIKEFALPMMVGILIGSYSSICLATPLWTLWKVRGGKSGYEN